MPNPHYIAIAVGGAIGATCRWTVAAGLDGNGFPTATFVANVFGCAVLGLIMAEEWTHPRARLLLHDFAGIGFCGGLTTFSTFAVDVVRLSDDGKYLTASLYLVLSLLCGFAAFLASGIGLRRMRALASPLEEEP